MSKIKKNTLSGLVVSQAMRRQVIKLTKETSISNSINALIKYKINALLTTDHEGLPLGVLSKTDIMGAYYADLPIDSPLEYIMSTPPLFCSPDDALEDVLQTMRSNGFYRLYVMEPGRNEITGVLAYPDIVGLLYEYCHACELSHTRQQTKSNPDIVKRFLVKEIMTDAVKTVSAQDTLLVVMEALSEYRFGAILVNDKSNKPCGVISKTDLTLAYKHGIPADAPAETIMSSPVQVCMAEDLLENAIKKMIFSDVHRLFVSQTDPDKIVGVFSLSDAARIRSGSCHACISSRIKLD